MEAPSPLPDVAVPTVRFMIDSGDFFGGRIIVPAPETATIGDLKALAELRVRKRRDAAWCPNITLVDLCVDGGFSLDDDEIAANVVGSKEPLTAKWQEFAPP